MIRLIVLIILLNCSLLQVGAQYHLIENRVWVFGSRSGLDFNTTTPVPLTTAITGGGGSYESSASVSDQFGRLLFYTNGESVWSRNHVLMPNGSRLPPVSSYSMVSSSSQGVVITPVIDSPGKYYIFSITCWEQKQSNPKYDGRLFYSVVDMQQNGGLGDVDPQRKWIEVDTGLGELMIAIPGNDNNIWIVTHANDTNAFRIWEVTSAGISTTPVTSYVGRSGTKLHVAQALPTTTYANAWWSFGQLAVSPSRKKIAAAFSRPNYAELFDFDPCTGVVSSPRLIDTIKHSSTVNYLTHTGVAFAPRGDKLYISGVREDFSTSNNYYLYQFDISDPSETAIAASKTQVGHMHNNTKLRLAPNGKIYGRGGTNQYLNNELNVVHRPDSSVLLCQYMQNDIILSEPLSIGIGSDFVKPFFVAPDTIWNKVLDTIICQIPDSGLLLVAPAGYRNYIWDDSSTYSTRIIEDLGAYRVVYFDGCAYYVDSFFVRGADFPPFTIGSDTLLCKSDSLRLTIPVEGVNYLWQDGQTTQQIVVTESGTYIATIEENGCTASDTIRIRYSERAEYSDTQFVFCTRDPVYLSISANAPPGAEILWSTGSTEPILNVVDSGSYHVLVTDGHCTFSDSFRVILEVCDCIPTFPSAFTPNGDGLNDIFRVITVENCPISEFSLHIYNRWGVVVYYSTDPKLGWDGNWNGEPSDAGTYMYNAWIKGGTKEKSYQLKGDVTLIR